VRDLTMNGPDALHRLRIVALIEGVTLLFLVGIAVPIKHLLGFPAVVAVAGPLHGLVFMFYLWTVIATAASESWSKREIILAVALALLPFAAFANAVFFHSKTRGI